MGKDGKMAFIYVITNQINQKQYVGKTTKTIQERWKNHIEDSKRRVAENRPLYRAINKYGIENFIIEQLEECSIDILSEREQYWIQKLNTYYGGYNATYGGDGKILYDYQAIVDKYLELQNQKMTAEFFNCDIDTVLRACREKQVKVISSSEVNISQFGKRVHLIEGNLFFNSVREAARFLQDENITINKSVGSIAKNISRVCTGERQSAYKRHWEFV